MRGRIKALPRLPPTPGGGGAHKEINPNPVLRWFWANFDSGFEIKMINCIYFNHWFKLGFHRFLKVGFRRKHKINLLLIRVSWTLQGQF